MFILCTATLDTSGAVYRSRETKLHGEGLPMHPLERRVLGLGEPEFVGYYLSFGGSGRCRVAIIKCNYAKVIWDASGPLEPLVYFSF